jgi:hypothetical protein
MICWGLIEGGFGELQIVASLFGVESYMLVLLHNVIVQSIGFTNMEVIWKQQYLNVVHVHHEQYNKQ